MLQPAALINPASVALALLLVSLLVAALAVGIHLLDAGREAGEAQPAWWRKHSMAHEEEAAGSGGKLRGGHSAPALSTCNTCGAADPDKRCANCSSVAYCSRECQQNDWKAGHKSACKKLRKQKAAEARRAAAAGSSSASAAEGAAGEAGQERAEGSNSQPPLPKQVLYPAERYAELAAQPPQRKQPLGLCNVGNSCYANSLLQSLLATPTLAAYLVSGEHGRGCLKPSASEWCVLCELEKLAQQAYAGGGSGALNPRPLLRHVKRLGKQFSFGRQEDSHELYLRLVEAVEEVQLLEAGGKARFDLRSRETTLIHQAFAGYTRNSVECLSCGHVSRTYECCTSLTLEVSARVASLEAALARYTAAERLDGDSRYKCDGCKSLVAAEKSTRFEAAPHHLQICLKRFAPGRYGKIVSKLSFPEELDLAPYMADGGRVDRGPTRYSLYAVVVHIDWGRSTDYGHYIAYVRCGKGWFCCDDSSVSPVAAAKVLSAGAYLLFYQREQPRAITPAAGEAAAAAAESAAGEAAAEGQAEAEESAAGPGAAAAGAAEPLSPRESLSRIETAPASLPHLGACQPGAASAGGSSSADLSASPSREQLLLEQEEEQRRGPRAIAAGTPEPLHASASDSDLPAATARASAASPARGLQQPREEAEEAAAMARAEVQALQQQQQQQQQQGGSPAASSSAGSERFAPSANPFDLLGPEDGEGGDEGEAASGEPEEDSSSSSSGGSSRGGGDAQAEEEPAGEAVAPAAAPKPQLKEDEEAADSPSSVLLAPLNSSSCAEVVDEEERRDAAGGAAEGLAAASPAAEPPAAQSASGVAGPQRQEEQQGEEQGPCTPTHRANLVAGVAGGGQALRLSVDLPGVEQEAEVDWRLEACGGAAGGTACQRLLLRAERWQLSLPLPVLVDGGRAAAKLDERRHKLTITWPVAAP